MHTTCKQCVLVVFFLFSSLAWAQSGTSQGQPGSASDKQSPTSTDYSKESSIVEKWSRVERFENDGTGKFVTTARIKIQSQAGVQQWGVLALGYNSENEKLEINYVRVLKPDGKVVTASADAIQDMTAPVTREAPVYTDFRQKHVIVPSLSAGDVLTYEATWTLFKALAPGEFWAVYDFAKRGIVLSEEYTINVPRDRKITLKSETGKEPAVAEEGDRRVYRWKSANLVRDDEDELDANGKRKKHKQEKTDAIPAVQMTTFKSWADVARWYANLQLEGRQVSPDVVEKARTLVQGQTSETGKIQAIYDYVAKNFRYVSLSFGMGRYKPHSPAEIVAHDYGDCKDKDMLLSALLGAVGIRSDSVLINSGRKLDPDVPSPAQFDHVITHVSLGGQDIWMDTTPELAPFRMLLFPIRDKKALVIAQDGTGSIVQTPADTPEPSHARVAITGKLDEIGKITAHVKYSFRGDVEVGLRAALRRLPKGEWDNLAKRMASTLNLNADTVKNVKASDPLATRIPLEIEFDLEKPNYFDWSKKQAQLTLPIPELFTTNANRETEYTEPIKLGPLTEAEVSVSLEIPSKYSITMPVPLALKRDYAAYSSEYTADKNVITVRRVAKLLKTEVSPERLNDLLAFRSSTRADHNQTIALEAPVANNLEIPKGTGLDDLNEAADAAENANDYKLAASIYERIAEVDPKYQNVWTNLCRMRLALYDYEKAVAACTKGTEIDPFDQYAFGSLASSYWQLRKYPEAEQAFKKVLELNPLSGWARFQLGRMYVELRRYEEAVPELEKAVSLQSDNSFYNYLLAEAYFKSGKKEKGLSAINRSVELSDNSMAWNNAAYLLSEQNIELDRALQYARSAVESTAAALRNIRLSDVTELNDRAEIGRCESLISYWDTLGWIHFQRGDLDAAERYIMAAWQFGQSGEVAHHLGHIAEKRGQKERALKYYALAVLPPHLTLEARDHFAALAPGKKIEEATEKEKPGLEQMRMIRLKQSAAEDSEATFYLVFVPGPKVEEVRFVSGSEKLKSLTDELKASKYELSFAENTFTRILRKGKATCTVKGGCTFILEPMFRGE